MLDFEPLSDPVVRPTEVEAGRWRYDTPCTPFVLWRHELDAGDVHRHHATGRELLLWVHGRDRGECTFMAPGETIELRGPCTVFVVEEG